MEKAFAFGGYSLILLCVVLSFSRIGYADCDSDLITHPRQLSASSTKTGVNIVDVRYDCCLGKTFAAWCPGTAERAEWLKVQFDNPTMLSGVTVQRPLNLLNDMYLTAFTLKVEYTTDPYSPGTLQDYRIDGNISVFELDDSEETSFNFTGLIIRSVLISVQEWVGEPCFRLGLYGCDGTKNCKERPLLKDIALIIQDDEALGEAEFTTLLEFCTDLVGLFDIQFLNTHVGVIRYGNGQEISFNLVAYNSTLDVQNAIHSMSYSDTHFDKSSKDIDSALKFAKDIFFTVQNGDRTDVVDLVIVLLDDVDEDSFYNTTKQFHDEGYGIIVVAWGNNVNGSFIKTAMRNDDNFLIAKDINFLRPLTQSLWQAICPDEAYKMSLENNPKVKMLSSAENFTLQCSFEAVTAINTVTYIITWYSQDTVLKIQNSDEFFTSFLYEEEMGILSFGGEITCTVKVCNSDNCERTTSDEKRSDAYLTGVEISKSSITVYEGEESVCIDIRITAPPRAFCRKDGPSCDVRFSYTIDKGSTITCPSGRIIPDVILGRSRTNVSSEDVYTNLNWTSTACLPITAMYDGLIDEDHTEVVHIYSALRVNETDTETENTTVQVIVRDRDSIGICQSISHQHITTFDGMHYDIEAEGEFLFYRHTSLPFEIHTFYQRCEGSYSPCTCAVAVRSDDDVIMFDKCDHTMNDGDATYTSLAPKLYLNDAITPGTKILRFNGGKKYMVILPTGAEVIVAESPVSTRFINVWLKASVEDYRQTKGCCGTFDDDASNDGHRIFWRTHELKERTLFGGICTNNSSDTEQYNNYHLSNTVHCFKSLDIHQYNKMTLESHYTGEGRAKDITRDIVDKAETPPGKCLTYLSTSAFIYNDTYGPTNSTWSTSSNVTEKDARSRCKEYIESHDSYKGCKNVSGLDIQFTIESCVIDIMVTDDWSWSKNALASLVQRCQIIVHYSTSYWVNTSESVTVHTDILDHMCPKFCSGRGFCSKGECQCDFGYGGDDCAFDMNKPPGISYSPQRLCDVRRSNCTSVQLHGSGFIRNNMLNCKIQKIMLMSGESDGPAIATLAEYNSYDHIWCTLPPKISIYNISVSNNNDSYSQWFTVIVYDSVCYKCNETTCLRKMDVCLINGTCYGNGAFDANNPLRVCDITTSTTSWTLFTDTLLAMYDFTFLNMINDTLVTKSGHFSVINGSELHNGPNGHFVSLDGKNQYIIANALTDTCIRDPSLCKYGFTLYFKLIVLTFKEDMFIFSNLDGSYKGQGISMSYRWGILVINIITSTKEWRVAAAKPTIDTVYYVEITWNKLSGLKLYLNDTLASQNPYFVSKTPANTSEGLFYIGRSPSMESFSNIRIAGLVVKEATKEILKKLSTTDITPSVNAIVSSDLCDVHTETYSNAIIHGDGFLDTVQLTCHYSQIQGANYITSKYTTNMTSSAQFVNESAVSCRLGTNTSVAIRISNDGIHTSSDAALLYFFDSLCFSCELKSKNINAPCILKRDSCHIDGNCQKQGSKKEGNECYICNPVVSRTSWSYVTGTGCQSSKIETTTVVAVSIGIVLVLTAGVFVGLSYMRYRYTRNVIKMAQDVNRNKIPGARVNRNAIGKLKNMEDGKSNEDTNSQSHQQRMFYTKEGYTFYYWRTFNTQ